MLKSPSRRQALDFDHPFVLLSLVFDALQLECRGAPVSFMESYRRDQMVDEAISYLRHLIIERRKVRRYFELRGLPTRCLSCCGV